MRSCGKASSGNKSFHNCTMCNCTIVQYPIYTYFTMCTYCTMRNVTNCTYLWDMNRTSPPPMPPYGSDLRAITYLACDAHKYSRGMIAWFPGTILHCKFASLPNARIRIRSCHHLCQTPMRAFTYQDQIFSPPQQPLILRACNPLSFVTTQHSTMFSERQQCWIPYIFEFENHWAGVYCIIIVQ